jgi:AraC family transcriptional regulator of adaptative response/methylated-DNA-[protein]-cysteine methyltransferase
MDSLQGKIEGIAGNSDLHRWQAVLARDAGSDGSFVYGVRSTGVYCRPSCPARRPRREQVVFFPAAEMAEAAGFRACRRCRPHEVASRDPDLRLVQQACRYIETSAEEPLKLATLGARFNVNPRRLQRAFTRLVGVSPRQYGEAVRLGRFKARVKSGEAVTQAVYEAGYGSSSRLYEKAGIQLGMTPGTYRRGGEGMEIRYTIVACPLGRLLMAATERGICAVSLGDADEALVSALFAEFASARLRRDDKELNEWARALLRHLDGEQPHLDLPLDVRATAFQKRVWEELRRIPYGQTVSYGEIASRIGQPAAARAVARACATNPVALLTPCQRVVREDGDPGGYRWGVERKRALLEREKASAGQAADLQDRAAHALNPALLSAIQGKKA